MVDVVFGALAQAIPDKTPAAPFGTTGVATVSGTHPETRKYYVAVYPYPGGYGASSASDGLVNGTPPGSMAKFMSVELSEHRYPVRFRHYAIREGSGGAGTASRRLRHDLRHRHACRTPSSRSSATASTMRLSASHGGGPAAPNSVVIRTDGESRVPPMRSKAEKVPLGPGDGIVLASPGGGGFGDPLERDPREVEADLNAG